MIQKGSQSSQENTRVARVLSGNPAVQCSAVDEIDGFAGLDAGVDVSCTEAIMDSVF
jgi:hypothetical protein